MPPTDHGLKGKVALVTGAGGGLGRATAIALADRGAKVLATDIDRVRAEETAHLVKGWAMRVDVAQVEDVEAMVLHAERALGPLYVAINNAALGQNIRTDMTAEEIRRMVFDDDELRRIFSVNLDGVRHGMKHQLRVMRPRKSGVIVNVASNMAIKPWLGFPMYSASKAAMIGLTRSIARRVAPEGIRINAICPGAMLTTMLEGSAIGEHGFRDLAASIPARRIATAEEIGRTIAWMCDADARFMIGHALVSDGGVTSW